MIRIGSGVEDRSEGPMKKTDLLNQPISAVIASLGHTDTLVIADAGGAIALAGIMGGEHSAISGDTRTLVLEAAFFTPQQGCRIVGRGAGQFGVHSPLEAV